MTNTYARFMFDTDYPFGADRAAVDNLVDLIRESWGSPELMRLVFPSRADDDEFLTFFARMTRGAATPRVGAAYFRYVFESVDVRQALPLIQAPTLILHNRGNPFVPVEHGRYLADHIAGAKLIEFPGEDTYLFPTEWASAGPEIAEFITGERPREIERILTTVLFSDIVGSTKQAAALGDQRWRSLLDAHDRAVREQLRRFRGNEINTRGDGFVASFDGPARAIRCGKAIIEATRKLGLQLRVGLHTGECEVRGDDLGGLSVHIAARVGELAGPDEVLVSGTMKDLVVGSGIDFAERGEHDLKGVPGTWKLFAVDR